MQRHFLFRRELPNRRSGVTIFEALLVILISASLIAALLYSFTTGEFLNTQSSAQSDLQAEARRAMDWITKDVREAVIWDIAATTNSPSATHIKFRPVQGWDDTAKTYSLKKAESGIDYYYYIEYNYVLATKIITRTETKVRVSDLAIVATSSWSLNNIIAAPFYTPNSSGGLDSLTSADLLSRGKLVVKIVGQKQVRGATNVNFTLTEEVKIRND